MCTSIVIWYIVNGYPVGVIVFFFVFTFVEFYFLIEFKNHGHHLAIYGKPEYV